MPAAGRPRRGRGSRRTVAVLGGGVAGLTAAHELAERGFDVTVYERKALGGKARSIPVAGTAAAGRRDLPAEHGFRAVFGFYQNLPDTMSRIPFGSNRNGVLDNLVGVGHAQLARAGGRDLDGANLTVPVDFEAFSPKHTTFTHVWESVLASLRELRDIPPDQLAFFARQVAMFFTSSEERRYGQWEYANWWDFVRAEQSTEEYRRQLADGLTRNLAAAKPKEMSVNSTGLVGESFAYSLMYRPKGPADRVLNGPTSEAWIDPWIDHLRGLGVRFRVGWTVSSLRLQGGRIRSVKARNASGKARELEADWFVSAVPVERARRLFDRSILAADPGLERLRRIRTDWMNGVIFHLDRPVPICHGHVNYVDSAYALTSISQAQMWARDIPRDYGDGRARESLSTIISDWSAPGIVYGKPAWSLRPPEIVHEVWAQLKAHLNDSGPTVLSDEMIVSAFVDPAIQYPAHRSGRIRIARNDEPLFINTPGSWDDRPEAATAVPNLFLAGDYARSTMNVATMESACETGRLAAAAMLRAARSSAEPVKVYERWLPPELEPLRRTDQQLYSRGQRHALDTPWPGG
jgi:uncharacterized protein with NAD-binding domain and iron-sulfur cluster